MSYSRVSADLIINYTPGGDSIEVNLWFHTSARTIEEVQFNDGTVHTAQAINVFVQTQTGTANADTMTGFGLIDDTLNGLGGDDDLNGLSGDDLLIGGDGADYLFGDSGDDYLQGDAGNDDVRGGANNDTLDGGAGDDDLRGGTGDDILIYDSTDSLVDGDAGADTLLVNTTGGASIDLSDTALKQLEKTDLTNSDNTDSVTLLIADVVRISDDNTMTIFGDAGDDVNSTDTWTRGADTTIDGNSFATFTGGSATIYLELGLDWNSVELQAL